MTAPNRLRLALDHIAEAPDDLTTLTSALDKAAFRWERLKWDASLGAQKLKTQMS